jgi:hypothetical protein
MSIFEEINNTTNKATKIGERYMRTHNIFELKGFQQLTLSFEFSDSF